MYSPPDQEEPPISDASAAIRTHLEGVAPQDGSRRFCNVWVHRLVARGTATIAYATYLCEWFTARPSGGVTLEAGGNEAAAFRLEALPDRWIVSATRPVLGVGEGFWDELARVFPRDLADELEAAGEKRAWPGDDRLRERAEAFFARE